MKTLSVISFFVMVLASVDVAAPPTTEAPPNLRELQRQSEIAKKHLIAAPTPQYPLKARQRRVEGSGLFRIFFDSHTGAATSVEVVQSTGHTELDRAAVAGFRQWRCRAGTVKTAVFPAAFTMRRK